MDDIADEYVDSEYGEREEEEVEESVVPLSHTVTHPGTVVVKVLHTTVTNRTVRGTWRPTTTTYKFTHTSITNHQHKLTLTNHQHHTSSFPQLKKSASLTHNICYGSLKSVQAILFYKFACVTNVGRIAFERQMRARIH